MERPRRQRARRHRGGVHLVRRCLQHRQHPRRPARSLHDQTYMERQIEEGVKEDSGRIVEAECPEAPPVGEGQSFDCAINDTSGERVGTAVITWDNNFGWFSWTTNRDTFSVDQT